MEITTRDILQGYNRETRARESTTTALCAAAMSAEWWTHISRASAYRHSSMGASRAAGHERDAAHTFIWLQASPHWLQAAVSSKSVSQSVSLHTQHSRSRCSQDRAPNTGSDFIRWWKAVVGSATAENASLRSRYRWLKLLLAICFQFLASLLTGT